MDRSELACVHACLILHDDEIEVTAEKISTLLKAANVEVESYWPSLFAKLCQKRNIDDLIMYAGARAGAAAAPAPAPVAAAASDATQAAPAAEEKKNKKEEVKEESEDDMVFGLFD